MYIYIYGPYIYIYTYMRDVIPEMTIANSLFVGDLDDPDTKTDVC